MNLTPEQALNRAAALCAATERCPAEIRTKALSWGLSDDEAEQLVARLIAENFICEERYARAFAHDKYRFQHWGRTKIRYALQAKGISSRCIAEALEEVSDGDEYLEGCVELLRGRMRNMSLPLSPNDRARLFRFAAQRGYEAGVIAQALTQCHADDDD